MRCRTLCCNANLLSCLSCDAGCRGQKSQDTAEGGTDRQRGDSSRMEMRHRKEENERAEQREGGKERQRRQKGEKGRKDALSGGQRKHEEKITRHVERERKEKRANKSNTKLPLTAADFL